MLRAFIKAALPAVEKLPMDERADAFEGMAIACHPYDSELAATAMHAAAALRDSMNHQLILKGLLS